MKRIVTLFLSLILLLSCLCAPASAMFDPSLFYEVQAKSAYIVNTDTNIIVYDKDSSRQVPAGGLTTYMTIALLLTNYADQLDYTFQMPFAISDYVHNSDNADMRSNETFTYREAVYAMLLRNANEAAMGLAYSLSGGDLAGWVSQMNTLSQRIGTTGSTWTDACGLDSGNVTTAVDMYLILRYLMSFDAFVDISSAPTFTMPAKEKHTKSFVLLNQNVALNKTSGGSFYRKSMQGGMCDVMAYKNDHGDQSYVSWANQDGSTYIFCIMQSPDTCDTYGYANRRPALYETTRLIDWVFQSFSIQPALDTDLALAEIPVKYSSDTDTLKLPRQQHDDPAALFGRRHRDPEILPSARLCLRPRPAGRYCRHRGAEAGRRDHRHGQPHRRAGREPEQPALLFLEAAGVLRQPLPQGSARRQRHLRHHLCGVGPAQLPPHPPFLQKSPPLWPSPRLSRAVSFFSEKAVKSS